MSCHDTGGKAQGFVFLFPVNGRHFTLLLLLVFPLVDLESTCDRIFQLALCYTHFADSLSGAVSNQTFKVSFTLKIPRR